MYIGKIPATGAFQKCDALSASATADYTLQVGSTNIVPESVNHMIVSLNGVIQQPTTAYTVSGAVLSFASALTSADTIDFVMLLGNVLDIGTPSDATVSNAKLASDLISGETDIGGAIADADLLLLDDGAGGTLRKSAASRIKTYIGDNTPAFEALRVGNQDLSDATETKLEYSSETYDTDSCYDHETNFRFLPTTAGKYYVYATAMTDAVADGQLHESQLSIFLNGSRYTTSYYNFADGYGRLFTNTVVATVDFDGSSDYVEIFVLINDTSGTPKVPGPGGGYRYNKFGAFRIIGT